MFKSLKTLSSKPARRTAAKDGIYSLYDDGSLRRTFPKVRGKAAVKAAKKARQRARVVARPALAA